MKEAALDKAARLMALAAVEDATKGGDNEEKTQEDVKIAAAQEKSRSGRCLVYLVLILTLGCGVRDVGAVAGKKDTTRLRQSTWRLKSPGSWARSRNTRAAHHLQALFVVWAQ